MQPRLLLQLDDVDAVHVGAAQGDARAVHVADAHQRVARQRVTPEIEALGDGRIELIGPVVIDLDEAAGDLRQSTFDDARRACGERVQRGPGQREQRAAEASGDEFMSASSIARACHVPQNLRANVDCSTTCACCEPPCAADVMR